MAGPTDVAGVRPDLSPEVVPKPEPVVALVKPSSDASATVREPSPHASRAGAADTQHHPAHPQDDSVTYGRRTKAVQAYCRELLGPDAARAAAEEILGSLTRNIRQDSELLRLTRTATAERLVARSQWDPTVQVAPGCANTPVLLAERANNAIDQARPDLEQHLAACLICRAAEVRSARADRAFAGELGLARPTKLN